MSIKRCYTSNVTGAIINETENRAVLHTALRKQDQHSIVVNGQDIMPD